MRAREPMKYDRESTGVRTHTYIYYITKIDTLFIMHKRNFNQIYNKTIASYFINITKTQIYLKKYDNIIIVF